MVVLGKGVVGGNSVDETVTSGFVVMDVNDVVVVGGNSVDDTDVDDVAVVESCVVSFDSIVSRQQLIAN